MKTRSYLLFVLIALLSLTAACQWVNRQTGGEEYFAMAESEGSGPALSKGMMMRAMAPPPPAPMMAAPAREGGEASIGQKVMRSASMTVEVGDVDDADRDARKTVEGMGGHVANSSAYEDNAGVKSLHLTLKVPSDKLDAALEALKKLGHVREEDTSALDVTEQYIDVDARLANAQKLEKRLAALVDAQGARLKDLMETERELGRVRSEIESLQARKRYMDNRIDLSTIEVTFVEPQGFGRGIFRPLAGIVQKALGAFTASMAALVIVTSALIPWIALMILAGWAMLRLLRSYLRHKREKKKAMNHNS